jgi:hypothetical protein
VDRRRVRLVYAAAAESDVVRAALAAFRAEIRALARAEAEAGLDLSRLCLTGTDPGGGT